MNIVTMTVTVTVTGTRNPTQMLHMYILVTIATGAICASIRKHTRPATGHKDKSPHRIESTLHCLQAFLVT
jgi:hypothetical protein